MLRSCVFFGYSVFSVILICIFCDFSSSDWMQSVLCFFNFQYNRGVAVLMGIMLLR